MDEDFFETGVNAEITRIISNNLSSKIAANEVRHYFSARASAQVQAIRDAVPKDSHGRAYSDADISASINTAIDLIKELVQRIVRAGVDDLLRRCPGAVNRPEAWIVPTLTGTTERKVYAHQVGAPGYALYSSYDNAHYYAPDGVTTSWGCSAYHGCAYLQESVKHNTQSEELSLRQLICGHKICSACVATYWRPDATYANMCQLCCVKLRSTANTLADQHKSTVEQEIGDERHQQRRR